MAPAASERSEGTPAPRKPPKLPIKRFYLAFDKNLKCPLSLWMNFSLRVQDVNQVPEVLHLIMKGALECDGLADLLNAPEAENEQMKPAVSELKLRYENARKRKSKITELNFKSAAERHNVEESALVMMFLRTFVKSLVIDAPLLFKKSIRMLRCYWEQSLESEMKLLIARLTVRSECPILRHVIGHLSQLMHLVHLMKKIDLQDVIRMIVFGICGHCRKMMLNFTLLNQFLVFAVRHRDEVFTHDEQKYHVCGGCEHSRPFGRSLQWNKLMDDDETPTAIRKLLEFLKKNAHQHEDPFLLNVSKRQQEAALVQVQMGQRLALHGESGVHLACNLLKDFLELLPVPLLSREILLKSADWKSADEQTVQSALDDVDSASRRVLHRLLQVMRKVVKYQATTRVTPDAMAGCCAPLMFRILRGTERMTQCDWQRVAKHFVAKLIKMPQLQLLPQSDNERC